MSDHLTAACDEATRIVPKCNFALEADDSYADRCGEIYITRKQYLVFHCCYCAENYGDPNEYLLHLYQHYAAENYFESESNEIDEIDEQTLEDIYTNEHDETINSANVGDDDCPTEQQPTPFEEQLCVAILPAVATETGEDKAESTTQEPPKHTCDICGLSCKSASNLASHKSRHTTPRQFACCYCAKKFHRSSELRDHERRHRGEKPFMCELCATSFYTSNALNSHYNRHTDYRPHTCTQCDKSFYTTQALKRHNVVHTQERKYACNVCPARFPRLRALKVHERLHENQRKYVCHICQHSFNQKTNMQIHLRGKHKVDLPENYVEPLKQKDYVKKKHNMEKLFSCAYCTKEFGNPEALTVHGMEMHDTNNNNNENKGSETMCRINEKA